MLLQPRDNRYDYSIAHQMVCLIVVFWQHITFRDSHQAGRFLVARPQVVLAGLPVQFLGLAIQFLALLFRQVCGVGGPR